MLSSELGEKGAESCRQYRISDYGLDAICIYNEFVVTTQPIKWAQEYNGPLKGPEVSFWAC